MTQAELIQALQALIAFRFGLEKIALVVGIARLKEVWNIE